MHMRNWLSALLLPFALLHCGSGEESAASNEGASGSKIPKGSKGGKAGAGGVAGQGSGAAGNTGGTSASGQGGGVSVQGGSGGASVGQGGASGSSPTEVCNDGLDNNGNGQVDEGCDCKSGETASCYPGSPSHLGPGKPCKAGTHTCKDSGGEFGAAWGPCVDAVLPVAEVCDGVDNDCDGIVDNAEGCECIPGEQSPCGLDVGACKQGVATCSADGKLGECVGGQKPEPETCDGVDNDCDGEVDEEGGVAGPCECVPGTQEPCGLAVGQCAPGIQVCQAGGVWSECVGAVLPKKESCNGKDDDCNGLVDDGLQCECLDGAVQPCGVSSVGACKMGQISCVDGKLSDCVGAVFPANEVCGNGVDDDCNGQVDEGCIIEVAINISGDCVCSAPCPANAPFPVGCDIKMSGGDDRGCVAIAGSQVYFQEGDACGAGSVSGKLFCSSQPGNGLNAQNCPINKSKKTYASKPSGCTKISSGKPGSCYFLAGNVTAGQGGRLRGPQMVPVSWA
jgi:hypothetical protein